MDVICSLLAALSGFLAATGAFDYDRGVKAFFTVLTLFLIVFAVAIPYGLFGASVQTEKSYVTRLKVSNGEEISFGDKFRATAKITVCPNFSVFGKRTVYLIGEELKEKEGGVNVGSTTNSVPSAESGS